MNKTPSAILSDALTSFNKAANLAFAAAQDQARRDVTHATADAREARRGRDEAVNALHAFRLEEQAWKEEAAVWKAAAKQAELTINHHLETVAQLRQEATQWKNQCLRLEETSRQEAISWKEQFLRVEQERSKLAQRVEELVAEQLSSGHVQTSAIPYTPIPRHSATSNLTASTQLRRASAADSLSPGLQAHPPSKSALSTFKPTSRTNRSRPAPTLQLPTPLSENQRTARQRPAQETIPPVSQPESASHGPRQILIRRVHAVVEVPVKEESVDRQDLGPDTRISGAPSSLSSASSSAPRTTHLTKTSKPRATEPSNAIPRVKRSTAMKRAYIEVDDESGHDGASQDPNQSDGEEYRPVSDGDDELLMGIEANRKEVYGMKRIPKPASFKTTTSSTALKRRKVPPPSKKRRPSATPKP